MCAFAAAFPLGSTSRRRVKRELCRERALAGCGNSTVLRTRRRGASAGFTLERSFWKRRSCRPFHYRRDFFDTAMLRLIANLHSAKVLDRGGTSSRPAKLNLFSNNSSHHCFSHRFSFLVDQNSCTDFRLTIFLQGSATTWELSNIVATCSSPRIVGFNVSVTFVWCNF